MFEKLVIQLRLHTKKRRDGLIWKQLRRATKLSILNTGHRFSTSEFADRARLPFAEPKWIWKNKSLRSPWSDPTHTQEPQRTIGRVNSRSRRSLRRPMSKCCFRAKTFDWCSHNPSLARVNKHPRATVRWDSPL